MEMEELGKEKATDEYEDAEGHQTAAAEAQAAEKEETSEYATLNPPEDIYSEAIQLDMKPKPRPDKQIPGNVRLYQAACVILSIICLILLVVVIYLLSVKSQTGQTYQEAGCGFENCKAYLPKLLQRNHKCQLCAEGWLTFEGWCFYLSKFRLNWEESQRNCSNTGGSLAVITNSRVQSFLTQKGMVKYWIGLRQNGNNWNWVNFPTLGESFWAERTSEGDCGILDAMEPPEKNWIKASCKASTYFICQRQL